MTKRSADPTMIDATIITIRPVPSDLHQDRFHCVFFRYRNECCTNKDNFDMYGCKCTHEAAESCEKYKYGCCIIDPKKEIKTSKEYEHIKYGKCVIIEHDKDKCMVRVKFKSKKIMINGAYAYLIKELNYLDLVNDDSIVTWKQKNGQIERGYVTKIDPIDKDIYIKCCSDDEEKRFEYPDAFICGYLEVTKDEKN